MSSPERTPPDTLVVRLRAAGCVLAEEEAALLAEAATDARLELLVARREAGEPLEHVLGWAAFAGLRVHVDPGVFVPRRSSELLVEAALRVLEGRSRPAAVDLCCGSGAVGAALLARRPEAVVHATDADPVAVACARRNLPPGQVHEGDLYAALPGALRGRLDVIVCHPPYVPSEQVDLLPREARLHERPASLDGGPDGLEVVRRVLAGVPPWLAPGGALLLQTSEAARAVTLRAAERAGLLAEVEAVEGGGVVLVLRPIRPDRVGVAE